MAIVGTRKKKNMSDYGGRGCNESMLGCRTPIIPIDDTGQMAKSDMEMVRYLLAVSLKDVIGIYTRDMIHEVHVRGG
jgi:hypothetical protein